MVNDKLMRIGELAERTNNTPQTIRFYEKKGLIHPTEREGGGHRQYDSIAVSRLTRIAMLKNLGLSLDEIAEVIDLYFLDESGIDGKKRVLDILRSHLRDTDQRLGELHQFRSELKVKITSLEKVIQEIESERKNT